MRKELMDYDVFPKIVRSNSNTVIIVRPRFDQGRFDDAAEYRTGLLPAEGYAGQGTWAGLPCFKSVKSVNGIISVECEFDTEQEYVLIIERISDQAVASTLEIRLYALGEDLFSRYPFKGDLHMHSMRSDGRESPAYVAGACRSTGFDFMAVTDHHKYAPSLEAIEAFKDVDADLRIFPGEEVHAPQNPVHIINFGGSFSVNDLFETDEYKSGVKAIQETLTDVPDGVDTHAYASCVWCFEKIREAGGLGIFCHPYWFFRHRYDVPGALTDMIFDRQPYDAYEILGGYPLDQTESNTLQVARYNEERAKGKHIPVVGVSDSHGTIGCGLFGWFYTIVFSSDANLASLIGSIKDEKSVAVEALPGDAVRAYGPFRLVRYSMFLIREIFPLHDELCLEEGRLMLAHLAGDEKAANLLREYKGRIADLYSHLWSAG